MQKVDRASVKAMELTAPGSYKADSLTISRQLRKGEIFGKFNQQERELIWSEIPCVSTDRLIPSLFTFFEDSNYLQGLADCIKQLVQLSDGDSLSAALRKHYSGIHQADSQCTIQQSESVFISRPGSLKDRVELGGRQIWAGAMRKYISIPMQRKKPKQDLLAKPIASSNDTALRELAALAYSLGFNSDKIQSLRSRSSDIEMARNVLLEARRPNFYQYDADQFEEFVEQIVGFFCTARDITEEEARLTFKNECSNKAPKRCGIPRTQDYEQDQPLLFLDNLHDYKEEIGGQMTSFFTRRSVYLAFFGEPTEAERSFSEQERPGGDIPRTQQEGLDNERLDDERLDNERMENERMAKEQERLENERLEIERLENERLENERLENERLENERLESERLENERLAKEQERLENERLVEEQERFAQEKEDLRSQKSSTVEAKSSKQQATSSSDAVQKAQNRVTRIDFNSITKALAPRTVGNHQPTEQTLPLSDVQDPPALTTATLPPSTEAGLRMQQEVDIQFKMKEHGIWKPVHTLSVNPADTLELQRLVIKYMRKKEPIYPYTKDMRMVKVGTCFEDAIADGENTLYLIPAGEDVDGSETYAAQPRKKIQQLESKIRIAGPLQLDLLKNDLRSRDNIIIISGAGISTNAGGKSYFINAIWITLLSIFSGRLPQYFWNEDVE